MALPMFSMCQLLEAGVHFGHTTRRWNPKMQPYLFGVRNGIHIIDLEQTVPMLHQAMSAVRDIVAHGGRVLFVGTKRQASERIADAARRSGQYYVNHRWLGGMMTNWRTISNSIKRLRELDDQFAESAVGLTKKETLRLTRERDKLERAIGGIKEMGGLPDVLFVIDTNKEAIAVAEARKLNISVVAVLDSNSDPAGITYPIPGNDDSLRAIALYCDLMVDTVLGGIHEEMQAAGVDLGAQPDMHEDIAEGEGGDAPADDQAAAFAAPAAEAPATPEEAATEQPAEPAAEQAPPEAEATTADEAQDTPEAAAEAPPEAESAADAKPEDPEAART